MSNVFLSRVLRSLPPPEVDLVIPESFPAITGHLYSYGRNPENTMAASAMVATRNIMPFTLAKPLVVSAVAVVGTALTAQGNVAVYSVRSNGLPGTVLAQAIADHVDDLSDGTTQVPLSVTLAPGHYYVGWQPSLGFSVLRDNQGVAAYTPSSRASHHATGQFTSTRIFRGWSFSPTWDAAYTDNPDVSSWTRNEANQVVAYLRAA